MNEYTVLWEGEDGEVYTYDFMCPDMEKAEATVKTIATISKERTPDSPKCDMWDACIEIQEEKCDD